MADVPLPRKAPIELDRLKPYLIPVLPTVFLLLALLNHMSRGKFFMSHVDPEYFHLFNGLNLAIFNLGIDFIHHPGTTIQLIFAASAPIVDLLLPGDDLITNAMNDPEMFIHGANILLNIITAGSLLLLGWYAYRYTGSIMLALLVQLLPFGHFAILLITGRLIPRPHSLHRSCCFVRFPSGS